MKKFKRRPLHLIQLIFCSILLMPFKVFCGTFTVNYNTDASTTSASSNTLRWAINQVNATSGPNTISFAISGSPPYIINLIDELPDIINQVTINGSNSGSDVIIGGNLSGSAFNISNAFGCLVFVGPGSEGSVVENLEFKYFSTAIYVEDNNNCSGINVGIYNNLFYNNDLDIELAANNCIVMQNTFQKDATDINIPQGLYEGMSGVFVHRMSNVPLNATNMIGAVTSTASYPNTFENVQGGAIIIENSDGNILRENFITQSTDPCASGSASLPPIILNGDVWTPQGNTGLGAPVISDIGLTYVSGRAPSTADTVFVYNASCCQCANTYLGYTIPVSGGNWSLTGLSGLGTTVTAVCRDASGNSSSLGSLICGTFKPIVIDQSGGCGTPVILSTTGHFSYYNWSKNGSSLGVSTPTLTTSGPGNYTVLVNSGGGTTCPSTSDAVTIY